MDVRVARRAAGIDFVVGKQRESFLLLVVELRSSERWERRRGRVVSLARSSINLDERAAWGPSCVSCARVCAQTTPALARACLLAPPIDSELHDIHGTQ